MTTWCDMVSLDMIYLRYSVPEEGVRVKVASAHDHHVHLRPAPVPEDCAGGLESLHQGALSHLHYSAMSTWPLIAVEVSRPL